MPFSSHIETDVFLPAGGVRPEILRENAARVLQKAIEFTVETHWETMRSPHIFMGLLATGDEVIREWCRLLKVGVTPLLDQFRKIFDHPEADAPEIMKLHREFLSLNAIELLRQAWARCQEDGRSKITTGDLLWSLLSVPGGCVVRCFEQGGVSAPVLRVLLTDAEQRTLAGKRPLQSN